MDLKFIRAAIKEAEKAGKSGEVPIGCVVVRSQKIIAGAHNQTIKRNDPTAHAELLAIRKAAGKIGNYRLTDCDVYVTVEPCPMCAGAMIWARINRLYFGAYDNKAGVCGSLCNLLGDKRFNHCVSVTGGILEEECAGLMRDFFKNRRF